jgi:membrane protein DedA with SNARE-associated domain
VNLAGGLMWAAAFGALGYTLRNTLALILADLRVVG